MPESQKKKPYFRRATTAVGGFVEKHPSVPVGLFLLSSLWPVMAGFDDLLKSNPDLMTSFPVLLDGVKGSTKLCVGLWNTGSFAYMTARSKKDGVATGTLLNTPGYSILMWPGLHDPNPVAVGLTVAGLSCLYIFNTPLITENFLVKPAQKMLEKFRAGKTSITNKISKALVWPFAYPRKWVAFGGVGTQAILAGATALALGQENLTVGFLLALTGCALLGCTKPEAAKPKTPENANPAP